MEFSCILISLCRLFSLKCIVLRVWLFVWGLVCVVVMDLVRDGCVGFFLVNN